MIIHLRALIYPLLLALYVGPFCEPFSRMLNEPPVKKKTVSEQKHIFMGIFVSFLSTINLWANEGSYVMVSVQRVQFKL